MASALMRGGGLLGHQRDPLSGGAGWKIVVRMEAFRPSDDAQPLLSVRTSESFSTEHRQRAHHGHAPHTRTDFVYPLSPREFVRSLGRGLYWHLMRLPLWLFVLVVLLTYSVLALLFSGLYWAVRDGFEPALTTFADVFFCAGGRMVGLGKRRVSSLSPHSPPTPPLSDGRFDAVSSTASLVALLQAFLALVCGAILTGLIYGRFASSSDSIWFSKHAVVTQHEGRDCLMFRIANKRKSKIKVCVCVCVYILLIVHSRRIAR